jgi:ribonuclease-3
LRKSTAWLKKRLAYQFQDEGLLTQALTHRSASGNSNERLEFLGDAVLQVAVSEVVFRTRATASEGQLSRLRSSLVKDTTLAAIALELELGEHLILGPGEKKSGGFRRGSILADSLEAIFGAVYLDRGMDAATKVIFKAYGGRLRDIPDAASARDPKSRLQEWLQGRALALPEYQLQKTSGKAHKQVFDVSCEIAELDKKTRGQGTTRRNAEQEAARNMLELVVDQK